MIGGAGRAKCPDTGLAVPECSCKRCLESMLREFHPGPLAGEIRVTRLKPAKPKPKPDSGRHKAA